jgi:hypothetical protein
MNIDQFDYLIEEVEEAKRITKGNHDQMRELLLDYKEARAYKVANSEKLEKEEVI